MQIAVVAISNMKLGYRFLRRQFLRRNALPYSFQPDRHTTVTFDDIRLLIQCKHRRNTINTAGALLAFSDRLH